jgi:hypothetical protein
MDEEALQSLKKDARFGVFQRYMVDKVLELDSTDGLEGLPNERAGEEVKVRAKTLKKLQEILAPFVNFKEKREPTIAEVEKAKLKAGF